MSKRLYVHIILQCGSLFTIVQGHLWGSSVDALTALLPANVRSKGFQTLILADLLFNHSEHQKLLQTVQRTLERHSDAYALVFFTPYRPWLFEKDLAFFDIAQEAGFHVEKIFEKLMDKVMFEEDPGVSYDPAG
jgi:nicotinamide N-methyltransferase